MSEETTRNEFVGAEMEGINTDGSRVEIVPEEYLRPISDESRFTANAAYNGSVGRSMFDTPAAEDGTVTVLLPADSIGNVPLQSMVRVRSIPDSRSYLGVVVSGPFAEPDGIRADATPIVTAATSGGIFMPRYHGRVQVELMGEEIDGTMVPPRFRPLPNSAVFVLESVEKERYLHCSGDVKLGLMIGDTNISIGAPPDKKAVLSRHLAILGTTGGGKSITVGTLTSELAKQQYAVIILDPEGEYTRINEATDDAPLLKALERRGTRPSGVRNTHLYHLVGTETANESHPSRKMFGLRFEALSPYTIGEILEMSDPQKERLLKTFDLGRQVLRDLKIFPATQSDERAALEVNEFEEGYPQLTLSRVIDLAGVLMQIADKVSDDEITIATPDFSAPAAKSKILQRAKAMRPDHAISWRATLGKLWRWQKLNVFDRVGTPPVDTRELLKPGTVSIIDLSDTNSPTLNNVVISDIIRRIQRAQDENYAAAESKNGVMPKVAIIIEEAHEFLSSERITKMAILFEQLARIAKRGRKRWLGLVFVTQLPQHLPREVLGLVNNYILHKITDEGVVRTLRHMIPGIDEGLWRRLSGLAPGQAIVSLGHMARPLLTTIDPAPCKMRMVD